jgi:integrase
MSKSKRRTRSKKQMWPYIRFSERENSWMVDARTKDGGSRKFFGTKVEAQTYAQQCRIQKNNSGTASFANQELARYGWSIHRAVDFALAHLRAQEKSIAVTEAMEQLIVSRKAAGRSDRYCRDLRLRLSRFAKDFENSKIGTITASAIDEWLAGLLVAPATRNTFRRDLRTLFSFCERRGYCQTNEVKKTERAKEVDKPAGILAVAQASVLLSASDDATLPHTAISLFAGLRAAEVQKLDWSEVDFESGYIEVTAAKSKSAKRRLVPISENLAAWIRPLAKIAGRVVPAALRGRLDKSRRKAGFGIPGTESTEGEKNGTEAHEMAAQRDASQLRIVPSCAVSRCSACQSGNGEQRSNGVCALSRDSEAEGCGALLENHAFRFRTAEGRLNRGLAASGLGAGRCFFSAARFELEAECVISTITPSLLTP